MCPETPEAPHRSPNPPHSSAFYLALKKKKEKESEIATDVWKAGAKKKKKRSEQAEIILRQDTIV